MYVCRYHFYSTYVRLQSMCSSCHDFDSYPFPPLPRGQVMNAEMLSNVVDVEVIYEGIRYPLKVSRLQPTGEFDPKGVCLFVCLFLDGGLVKKEGGRGFLSYIHSYPFYLSAIDVITPPNIANETC